MKRVYVLPVFTVLFTAFSFLACAQDAAPPAPQPQPAIASTASHAITTKLQSVLLPQPATEEGFATVRVADASGEAVYRGMIPLVAGAQTIDLSKINVPAAGRYSLRVVYPGGTLMEELETLYNLPASTEAARDVLAGR